MYINEIEWLDIINKEAILHVINEGKCIRAFSCPCNYKIGDVLAEPLECIDIENVIIYDDKEDIEKLEGTFDYILRGRLLNKDYGIFRVYGFDIHINSEKIPKDILEGEYIQFVTSRIDVW